MEIGIEDRNAMTALSMRDHMGCAGLETLCANLLRRDYVAVEIGVFAGEGSEILSRHVARLICIDPWDSNYENTSLNGCSDLNLKRKRDSVPVDIRDAEARFDELVRRRDNIVKIRGSDADVVDLIAPDSIDAIYIDAVHTYDEVTRQLSAWSPKIRSGGIIAGHDFSPSWPGVMRAVTEQCGHPQHVFEDTSWAILKR